ncbi:MAG: DNA alkylation repair protein [candidate division WOR-3 bacterium]|nr:MAG: DNA alkylation repair protein [candidate division WOR-3 bacterium]
MKSRDNESWGHLDRKGTRDAVVRELKKHVDEKYRRGAEAYFKEGILLYGVRANKVRKIAADSFKKIRKENKKALFGICEELLRSKYSEEKTIAFAWAYRVQRQYTPRDFRLFELWLKRYVGNWGSCDDFCRHAFGVFLYRFPQFLPDVLAWTDSKNRWLRRGAAVIMIYSLRMGEHLDFAFNIADALVKDEDYLVQNGYGWMLKDASIRFPSQVLRYVEGHAREMPRRALRYAIERFTPEQRHKVMGSI